MGMEESSECFSGKGHTALCLGRGSPHETRCTEVRVYARPHAGSQGALMSGLHFDLFLAILPTNLCTFAIKNSRTARQGGPILGG